MISTVKKIFQNKTNNTLIQLFRYVFVGGFAFAADFTALFLLTEYLHIHYLVSATASFILGILINYYLSVAWVFEKHSTDSKKIEFVVFALVGIIGLLLNIFFIWYFTEIVNYHYLFSKIISTTLVFAWNFGVRKHFLFR